MKNIRVGHGVEFTRNIGNFENVKPNFNISADVEEGETAEEVYQKLVDKVDGWADAYLETIDGKKKK